jgi:NTE family protein
MKQNARIVLSGGAAFGLAHIGVLKILEKQYNIVSIVGTSMGAMVGGLYASGYSTDELLAIATKSNNKRLFNPLNLDTTMSGVFDGKMLLKLFEEWTQNKNIEDCKIPFVAISYDLIKRNTVVINKGSLAKAMRASSSIPYIFAPLQWGKYSFVDGGVEYPMPLGLGHSNTKDITIAVNVLPSKSLKPELMETDNSKNDKNKMRLNEVFLRCIIQNQAYMALHAIADNKPDIVIDAWYPEGNVYGFDDADAYYRWGIIAANKTLDLVGDPGYKKMVHKEYRSNVSNLGKRLQKIAFDLGEYWNVKK